MLIIIMSCCQTQTAMSLQPKTKIYKLEVNYNALFVQQRFAVEFTNVIPSVGIPYSSK